MNPTGNYPVQWLPPGPSLVVHFEVTTINGSPPGPAHYEMTVPPQPPVMDGQDSLFPELT